jgi:superfamily II DNA/RNA helicase
VQERAWPLIARGAHVLVSAPTGTGKTLAAFLWGIDRLVTGALSPGTVRILYVSPLKALNNDIERNLLAPLAALRATFAEAGEPFPDIQVQTRSGDTPANDRRRMQVHPPEILITTPESLNLILSSARARLMLGGVATVILDEIHAVADTKRGTHLITAVDRLVRVAGEFQRIALSATVKPLRAIAELVGLVRPSGNDLLFGLEHDLGRVPTLEQGWWRLCETSWALGFVELRLVPEAAHEAALGMRLARVPGGGSSATTWAFEVVVDGRRVATLTARRGPNGLHFDPARFVGAVQLLVGRFVDPAAVD